MAAGDRSTYTRRWIMSVDYSKEFDRFLEREKHLGLMIRSRVKKYGDKKVAVRHKPHGDWIAYTWATFGSMIESTARALLEAGAKENEMVGIFAANSAWWAVADYACFTIRACSVPVYATNSAKELEYIVNDARIRILFAGNQDQYEKAMVVKKTSKYLKKIVVLDRKSVV